MSANAHYIIFHPESNRELVNVHATVVQNGRVQEDWSGRIWVDGVENGNEDPFVFNDPWLFSYCHASQLRRQKRDDAYLQVGSWLLFCNGQAADKGQLIFDTLFVIGGILPWKQPLGLPEKFRYLSKDKKSPLWQRHFRFPFKGTHDSVTHTYEAMLWDGGKSAYSFLPYADSTHRVNIALSELTPTLAAEIEQKVWGKFPVLLSAQDIQVLLQSIESKTRLKVLRDIVLDEISGTKKVKKRC